MLKGNGMEVWLEDQDGNVLPHGKQTKDGNEISAIVEIEGGVVGNAGRLSAFWNSDRNAVRCTSSTGVEPADSSLFRPGTMYSSLILHPNLAKLQYFG